MRTTSIAPFFLLGTIAACSSSGDTNPPTSDFDGTWSCSETSVLTYTTPPGEAAPQTETVTGNLVIAQTGSSQISAAETSDAGSSCPLDYATTNDTATLSANQVCKAQGITFSYAQGMATVSGNTLKASNTFSFTGSITQDGGALAVVGTGTTAFTCTK